MAKQTIHTEEVEDNAYAVYPTSSGYSDPSKNGYLFDGWKFKNNVYKAPYTATTFGPITEDTEISVVWDKLTIHADANRRLVSGDGDIQQDPTKLYSWISSDAGKMITQNVSIQQVALDSGMLPIVFSGTDTTSVVDNKNVTSKIVAPNDVEQSRYYRFKAVTSQYGGMESAVVQIEQSPKDQTVLNDFDFLTFKYTWSQDDGQDLDTSTRIMVTQIVPDCWPTKTLQDFSVGYKCLGSYEFDPDYGETEDACFPEISQYIKGGGDNQDSGNESALINLKKVCDEVDFESLGITTLTCELYASWYYSKANGNCQVSFSTYKTPSGTGGMQLDRDNQGHTLFTFSPTGDTEQVGGAGISGNVFAGSHYNAWEQEYSPTGDERGFYSHVATLEYNVVTKDAILINHMKNTPSGRLIYFDFTAGGVNATALPYTEEEVVVPKVYESTFTGNISITIDRTKLCYKFIDQNIDTTYDWEIHDNDTQIQQGMSVYPVGWITLNSTTRGSDNKLLTLNFSINSQNNDTTNDRTCFVRFSTVSIASPVAPELDDPYYIQPVIKIIQSKRSS